MHISKKFHLEYFILYKQHINSFSICEVQANLDMTDSMGPGKLVRHMQNLSYTYDKYLICIGLGPNISSVICKNPSYSGPSYPSSPVVSHRLFVLAYQAVISLAMASKISLCQFNKCLQDCIYYTVHMMPNVDLGIKTIIKGFISK